MRRPQPRRNPLACRIALRRRAWCLVTFGQLPSPQMTRGLRLLESLSPAQLDYVEALLDQRMAGAQRTQQQEG